MFRIGLLEYLRRLGDQFDELAAEFHVSPFGVLVSGQVAAQLAPLFLELVAGAPRLIPVYAHRYLLIEPCVSGNPVLSIWQDDIIVYGQNLRNHFLAEFADLLGLDRRDNLADADEESVRKVQSVPFWGELVAHNEES